MNWVRNMFLKLSPCIIKPQGSMKILEYTVSISRQMGSISRNTAAKLSASESCSVTSSENKLDKEENTQAKSSFRKVDSHSLNSSHSKTPRGKENAADSKLYQIFKVLKMSDPLEKDMKITEIKADTLSNNVNPAHLEWRKQVIDIRLLPRHYMNLSKLGQAVVAVLTTLPGYGMAPGAFEPVSFTCLVLGVALLSAASFSVNQVLEVPYDSQRSRTKNRVLVRGYLTPLHASIFAVCCASIGFTTLYLGTNALTAILVVAGFLLYTIVYTPMKRYSIANTWVGSAADAITPLAGWAACTGSLNASAVLLSAIVYSWGFQRLNALPWISRSDYSRLGYCMTSVIDPAMCRRVALRHSVGLLILCSCAPLLDLTTWTFAFDSFPLNCYFIYRAWRFFKDGDNQSAQKLVNFNLIYLPVLIFLMLVGKKYSS